MRSMSPVRPGARSVPFGPISTLFSGAAVMCMAAGAWVSVAPDAAVDAPAVRTVAAVSPLPSDPEGDDNSTNINLSGSGKRSSSEEGTSFSSTKNSKPTVINSDVSAEKTEVDSRGSSLVNINSGNDIVNNNSGNSIGNKTDFGDSFSGSFWNSVFGPLKGGKGDTHFHFHGDKKGKHKNKKHRGDKDDSDGGRKMPKMSPGGGGGGGGGQSSGGGGEGGGGSIGELLQGIMGMLEKILAKL